MKRVIDYYEVLNISYFATADEIKEAYRTKVKETHPDSRTGDSEHFKLVQEAYEILSSEEKRKRYNDFLFQYNKVNSPVNIVSKEPLVNNESVKNPLKKKPRRMWTILSLVLNITLLVIILWVYNQFTHAKSTAADIREELEQTEIIVAERESEIQAVNYEYGLLQTEYDQYKESMEESLAAAQQESVETTEETIVEQEDTNNPNGYFTQGSTKDHVKQVMGTPTGLNKMPLGGETWWYGGAAYINFNPDGLVEEWTDFEGNVLKVQMP